MEKTSVRAHLLARLRSMTLARADLVEAVYCGTNAALARLAERPALWVVVGERDEIALLAPHPLPLDRPADAHAVPITEFDTVTRLTTIVDIDLSLSCSAIADAAPLHSRSGA